MRFEEFGALVARYEAEAARDPAGYPRRVLGVALAGIAYILTLLLLLSTVGTIICLIAWKIHFYLGFAASSSVLYAIRSIVRALRGEGGSYEPERVLTRQEAPGLFATLEALGGRVDSVELTTDFNAAMAYIPRFGVLGWARHHLVIGMPLLLAMSEAEARSVIAHELGHMSGGHNRRIGWIYRQRRIWASLREEAEHDPLNAALLKPFWTWVSPRFGAMSFVLSRLQEYEADAAAARATSPQIAGEALARVHVDSAWLDERHWRPIHALSATQDTPPGDTFTQMAAMFQQPRDAARVRALLDDALAERTSLADTHPCLRERLEALGVAPPEALAANQQSAAQAWFADLPAALAALDAAAALTLAPGWREQGAWERRMAQERAALDAEAPPEEEDADNTADPEAARVRSRSRAARVWRHRSSEEGIAALRAHAARFPDDEGGRLDLGRALLAAGEEEEGAAQLRAATLLDKRCGGVMCEIMITHLLDRQSLAAADQWRDELARWEAQMETLRAEWGRVDVHTELAPHGLSHQRVADLLLQLAPFGKLREVWLARKEAPPHFPDEPVYIIAFSRGGLAWDPDQELLAKVIDAIDVIPGALHVFDVTPWRARKLRRALERVEDARLF